MIHGKIEGETRMMNAPGDMEGYCGGLSIRDESISNKDPETGEVQHFGNFMVSQWELTDEERNALIDGACVYLYVRGEAHPVVMVSVGGV